MKKVFIISPMQKILLIVSCLIFHGFSLHAQDTDILLNHDLHHYIDRLDIKQLTGKPIATGFKPFRRDMLTEVFENTDTTAFGAVERIWHHRMRIIADDQYAAQQSAKGIWNTFYTNGRDLFQTESENENFELYINPAFHTTVGVDLNTFSSTDREALTIYNNVRGLSIRGTVFNKIGFYTDVMDNVIRIPQFMFDRYQDSRRFPGEPFVKRFTSTPNGLDFFSARGYLTFSPVPQIRIKAGKDRAFWGNGFQSLLLSDHASDYLFINIQSQIWKFVYVNHFTQMLDYIPGKADDEGTYPRKYAVFHQLSYFPLDNLSFSVFESIVYTPYLPNGKRGFEVQYLNPVIFYRSVEQSLGSPDNSFIGFAGKWNFLKHYQLYGQFVIDDLNISRRNDGDNYWGNKYGFQAGIKYIDAFNIPTLDFMAEYNRVRPYTYQHFNIAANYSNFDESLGHASGANLENFQISLRYHPLPAWNVELSFNHLKQGLDTDGINYGSDINRSYAVDRAGDFDQMVAQGDLLTIDQVYGRLTYQIWNTDMYAEVQGRYRQENDRKSASIMAGLRLNIPNRVVKY